MSQEVGALKIWWEVQARRPWPPGKVRDGEEWFECYSLRLRRCRIHPLRLLDVLPGLP